MTGLAKRFVSRPTSPMNLKNARVIGFFSLPSPDLAEHNPAAYNAAMAGAPAGAGTCAHCGTGIRNHVIVSCDGETAFIGSTCAEKIGGEVYRCSHERLTSEQVAARDAKRDAENAALRASINRAEAFKAERAIQMADIIRPLTAQGTEFHASLAQQLVSGPLSFRQATFAVKTVIGRQTKKNADAWNQLFDRCTA